MSNFNKVILSLLKIKSKNFGQNQENQLHYLVQGYSFSNDEGEILIVDAIKANAIKSVIFNGKTSYRIVKTDNVSDATVLFPDTQEEAPEDITPEDTIIPDEADVITTTRDTATNTISNEQEVDDVSALIERKFNDLSDKVEKRLQNIEDQIVDMQLSNLSGNNVSGKAVTSENFLHVDILKNRILELEKQISEKNTIIDFLTKQLFAKSHDISKGKWSHNIIERNCINKDKNNDSLHEEKGIEDLSNKVVITGGSMLNNINSRGLSKSKEVDVLNFPGATSSDVLTKIDDVLNKKPASLIVHVGTNDLTNDINLLSNVKKIVNKTNKTSPNTVLTFSSIIFRKDKKNLEKTRADTNSRLKNFCRQKNINLISNDNIKEEHLGIKTLHLNRKGNGIFSKNLLNFIEGN